MYHEAQGSVKVNFRWGYCTSFCREREEPGNCEKRTDEMDGGARREMKHSCVLEDKKLQRRRQKRRSDG